MKINILLIKKYWILTAIIVLAALFRFWHLGSVPPSLNPDEAALGFNAFSILKSGRDEYGKLFPLIFQSFGDYKPGLYVYFSLPSILLFGLNSFSTRLVSAVAGVVVVFLIYKISKYLFGASIGIFSAFVAATNPWLIYFSRGTWEANLSLALTLGGIYLFFKSFKHNNLLILSALFFASTLLTYQGAKLSTFLVVLLLIFIYRTEILKFKARPLIASFLVGILISIPVIASLFNGQTQRLTVFSIFSYPRPTETLNKFLAQGSEKNTDLGYYLFHSESVNFIRAIAGRWFNGFSGKFLFFEGDTENPINSAPYQGMLLITDLLILPIGLFSFFKNKIEKEHLFILLWLVLAPFSAAISRDTTNAVRSLNTAVPLLIIMSFGLSRVFALCKNTNRLCLFYISYAVILFIGVSYFVDAYFIHGPAHNSMVYRYGYDQAVKYVLSNKSKYSKVVFEQSYNQPYIYFLFNTAMNNPKNFNFSKYQNQISRVSSDNSSDVGFVENFDDVEFKKLDWQVLKRSHSTLVIAGATSVPPEILNNPTEYAIVWKLNYLNNRDVAFYAINIK